MMINRIYNEWFKTDSGNHILNKKDEDTGKYYYISSIDACDAKPDGETAFVINFDSDEPTIEYTMQGYHSDELEKLGTVRECKVFFFDLKLPRKKSYLYF